MHRTHGPISDRLRAEFPPGSPGWAPSRDASLHPAGRAAAVGYRIGRRRRSGRKTWWFDFATALLNLCGPTWALMLLIGVTQAASLGYLR